MGLVNIETSSKIDDKYDVIIIGAGIGGLTCGCYLAKAGMKVLIVEQHHTVGGYCTSFKRGGFVFDAGVHALGSCREDGKIGTVLKELNLNGKLQFHRINTLDTICSKDINISINSNFLNTLNELKSKFPLESKNLQKFTEYILNLNLEKIFVKEYYRLKKNTFYDLLCEYFSDQKIIYFFSSLLFNIGLPSKMVSALSAIILYKEFIFDGGYYPIGGMEAFPNALKEIFINYKGDLLLSHKVKNIHTENKEIKGCNIQNVGYIPTKYVVSNCDTIQTFIDLIKDKKLEKIFISKVKKFIPSPSMFLVYLGLDTSLKKHIQNDSCITYFPSSTIDEIYQDFYENKKRTFWKEGVVCFFPSLHDRNLSPKGKDNLILLSWAKYKEPAYWEKNKDKIASEIIKRIESLIPNINKHIEIMNIATPITLYKYTSNYNGAMHG